MLNKTIAIAQEAYNNGCKKIDDKNAHENETCEEKFRHDAFDIRFNLQSQLNSLMDYYKIFDSDNSYSNETLIEDFFNPFDGGIEDLMFLTYGDCDFKIIQGRSPDAKGTYGNAIPNFSKPSE